MQEKHFDNLDSNEKVLYMQVVANPSHEKILLLEKEELEQQILNFYRNTVESDASYYRRNEDLHIKYRYIKEQINLLHKLRKNN